MQLRWPSAALGVVLIVAVEASAQPVSAPPGAPETRRDWNVAAGNATFAFRDIAITGIPMDGSPTSLEGGGPAIAGRYERSGRGRRHRFDVVLARASGLEYVTAVDRTSLPSSDHATRVDGSYDYRAYPARDVVVDGLDIGVGVNTGVGWRGISRRFASAIDHARSEADAGVAGVVAARVSRWPRAEVEVGWTLGLAIARSSQTHTGDAGVQGSYWGGGWRSELSIEGRVPVARHAHLAGRYAFAESWRMTSHHSYAVRQGQLTIGVMYVR